MDLIEALVKKQKDAELPPKQMAAKLGVTRRYYDKLVTGERSPGVQPLAGTIQSFPDLWPHVLAFLAGWKRHPPAAVIADED